MTSSSTSTPAAARDHARAMAGTRVEAMPTIPATRAIDLPDGVAAQDVIWDETIAAGGYASRRLNRGARLRLTDLRGDACLSMLAFNADQTVERLNVADTLKVQWSAYLGAGRLLLSDMGRVLFSLIEDTAGGHDALCGASNTVGYGDGQDFASRPTARERFLLALTRYGLGRRDAHPCINWFKSVTIADDGATELQVGPFAPGRYVTLRAEMDLIVVLANCPHALDPRDYTVTPVRATAWRGPVTSEDDPIRHATPEGLRAFQIAADGERPSVTYRRQGDRRILVEYGPIVLDIELRLRVHALMLEVQALALPGVIDITPGIRSLQVHFDSNRLAQTALLDKLIAAEERLAALDDFEIPTRIGFSRRSGSSVQPPKRS